MANYPNLRGDLDADPMLLTKLNWLAKMRGAIFTVTSGKRSRAEQARLYANRGSNPYPVAAPGTSRHESGLAADVLVNGKPIQNAIPEAQLRRAGLVPLKGDAVHVELGKGGGVGKQLSDAGSTLAEIPGAAGSAIAGAAGDVAGATAKAIVQLLVKALGDDAVRLALYPAFLGAGLTLAGVGVARMLGIKPADVLELAATRGASSGKLAAGKGASAAAAKAAA